MTAGALQAKIAGINLTVFFYFFKSSFPGASGFGTQLASVHPGSLTLPRFEFVPVSQEQGI